MVLTRSLGAVAASGRFSTDEKKDLEIQGLSLRWCPEGDSNNSITV